jgi:hypothetical protein
VRRTKVGTPVTSPDWQNAELRNDYGGTDGSGNFLRCLNTKTNVTLRVSNDNNSLESSTLTGTSLFLDWLDLCWINVSYVYYSGNVAMRFKICLIWFHTFITSSFSFGRKKSTI